MLPQKNYHTQQQKDGAYVVQLEVELNKELEARILEFGCDVEVLSPPILRDRIIENLGTALANYHLTRIITKILMVNK